MRKQNLLFILLILGSGIGLFSCNLGEVKNVYTYPGAPAVVDYNLYMGGTTIGTPWGYFAAPSLIDVYEGTCLYISEFTIDYDNQPSDQFLTATGISKEIINQTYLNEMGNPAELNGYTLPFSGADAITSVFYRGKFFIGMGCKDKNPDFRLVFNPEEEEIDGIKNLYLQARPSSTTENASDVSAIQAFDMLYFIQRYGRDTTVTYSGYSDKFDLKYIRANLKYVSIVTDGIPEYQQVNTSTQPFEIAIFNNY